MSGLADRTVLVTGASKGIGLAIARALRAAGAWVAMVARTEPELWAVASEVAGHALRADVTSEADVQRLVAQLERLIGGAPEVVVNAAGSFALAPIVEMHPADFDRQLATNLRGPFLVTRAFLPGMLARRSGHVINIGSVAGRLPMPGNAAYSASKFGLRGMHEVLALELRGSGVRTTLIEPAATDTPLWDPLDPDARIDLPSRPDMLRPDDVARAVLFALEQPANVEVSVVAVRSAS